MSGEGFTRRWARLKRGAPAVADAEAPEEVPPDLESLDLSEVAAWLRRRVPQAWKIAAMRKLWVADPAIRNFVGLADYAGDWNTPGGVAGFGPMTALDDMAELLRRAMGTPAVVPEATEPASVDPPVAMLAPASDPIPVLEARDAGTRRRGGGATPVAAESSAEGGVRPDGGDAEPHPDLPGPT